jgi:hypothetical protein
VFGLHRDTVRKMLMYSRSHPGTGVKSPQRAPLSVERTTRPECKDLAVIRFPLTGLSLVCLLREPPPRPRTEIGRKDTSSPHG